MVIILFTGVDILSQMVLDNFIPPMLEAVLADYQRCSVPR